MDLIPSSGDVSIDTKILAKLFEPLLAVAEVVVSIVLKFHVLPDHDLDFVHVPLLLAPVLWLVCFSNLNRVEFDDRSGHNFGGLVDGHSLLFRLLAQNWHDDALGFQFFCS